MIPAMHLSLTGWSLPDWKENNEWTKVQKIIDNQDGLHYNCAEEVK